MITDVLARLAVLKEEIPEAEFDVDDAVDAAASDIDRDLSGEEWSQLNELLPEWLEESDEELVADGGRVGEIAEIPRVMVDIETLGLHPGAAILSIGAVQFTKEGLGDTFYREISLTSCQDVGLEIDAETLDWWLNQDDAVNGIITGGGNLYHVLKAFNDWYPEGAEVWANSPAFDCKLLEAAYDAVHLDEPWSFHDERDVRTLKSLPCAANVEMDGDEHHALDDAKHQARFVAATLRILEDARKQVVTAGE
jgi:hypothetical protein